jgi:hypothetical protein
VKSSIQSNAGQDELNEVDRLPCFAQIYCQVLIVYLPSLAKGNLSGMSCRILARNVAKAAEALVRVDLVCLIMVLWIGCWA